MTSPVPGNGTAKEEGGVTEGYPGAGPTLERPYLSFGKTLGYSIANLGYGAFYTLNNAILSLYLRGFTSNAVLIGILGSTHSFEGAVIQPLVGSASDRMRSGWGRRRPFMLVSIPISALFLLLTPVFGHLPSHFRLALMVACIFLFTVSFNIAQDPYNALMPDITPELQRGRVTGISMFIFLLGQVILVFLPEKLGPFSITTETKFTICALLMLATTLITCLAIREPEHKHEVIQKTSPMASILIALKGLGTLHQARKALLVSFLSGLGIGAVFPFITIFVKTITHCTDNQAEKMFLYLVGSTAICVLPFGWLSDKIGPRAVLLIALGLIATAAFAGLSVNTLDQIKIVMVLAGVGNAAQFSSAYPLLYQLVPPEEVGFYTGLQSTALSIATPLTSVITGMLVNRGGYRRIFIVCTLCVACAIAALAAVKRTKASFEIAEREEILRKASSGRELPTG